MKILLAPHETAVVELEGTDGRFEVHFDTDEHPSQLIVKEVEIGTEDNILFEEHFGVTDRDDPEEQIPDCVS